MKPNFDLLKRYGLFGLIRLLIDVLATRIFFPGARIVRRPFYIRGRRHIKIGRRFTSGVALRIDAFPIHNGVVIKIGSDVQVNDYVHIASVGSVVIGSNTLIASKVFISDHHHGDYRDIDENSTPEVPPALRPLIIRPVTIGERVWIGESACILPGVNVGDGAVIGAGAVVSRNIPANSIAVGNPAVVVRRFDESSKQWLSVS
ncbi:MAG: acetyltransferase [Burkholderiales bacterium]|nr:acetyltransferase [Burkholderiales bacterium]